MMLRAGWGIYHVGLMPSPLALSAANTVSDHTEGLVSPGAEGWWLGLWCDSQLESRPGCNQGQPPPKQSVHMHTCAVPVYV